MSHKIFCDIHDQVREFEKIGSDFLLYHPKICSHG